VLAVFPPSFITHGYNSSALSSLMK